MQYNLEEFDTIKDHIQEMDIQSQNGFVCLSNYTILLFDMYLIIEIEHLNSYFNISIKDTHNNDIHRYSVYELCSYKPKYNEARKLIDKRFNQIISLWEQFKLNERDKIKQDIMDALQNVI